MFCASVYYTKIVHFILISCDNIGCVLMERKFWSKIRGRFMMMNLLWLNQSKKYNFEMNDFYVAYQMRLSYRFDVWICNGKWQWSLFLWVLQVLVTNDWVYYKVYQKEQNIKLKFTHYEFIRSICLAWIDEDCHFTDQYGNGLEQYASPVP